MSEDLLAERTQPKVFQKTYEITTQDRQNAQEAIHQAALERFSRVGQNISTHITPSIFKSYGMEYGTYSNLDKNYAANAHDLVERIKTGIETNQESSDVMGLLEQYDAVQNQRQNLYAQRISQVYEADLKSKLSHYRKLQLSANPTLDLRTIAREIITNEVNQQFNENSTLIRKYFDLPANLDEQKKFMKNLAEYCDFALVQSQCNLTGEFISDEAARELIADAGSVLVGGMIATAIAPISGGSSLAVGTGIFASRGKKLMQFAKHGTAFYLGMNAFNLSLGRTHRVDISPESYAQSMVLLGILKIAGTLGKAGFKQAVQNVFKNNRALPVPNNISDKALENLYAQTQMLQKLELGAELTSEILAMSVYGVIQADKNDSATLIDHIQHNLIFFAMLRVANATMSKLKGPQALFTYKNMNAAQNFEKEINPLNSAKLPNPLTPEFKIAYDKLMLDAQNSKTPGMALNAMQMKILSDYVIDLQLFGEEPLRPQDIAMADRIAGEVAAHKAKIWGTTSLQEQLTANQQLYTNKLNILFEQMLQKYDPNGSLGLKNKIALYLYGSAGRGEVTTTSDADYMLVSSADKQITQDLSEDLALLAYRACIGEPKIPVYYTNEPKAPAPTIPWNRGYNNSLNSYSYNGFRDKEVALSEDNHSRISRFIDQKLLTGPDLLKNQLVVDQDKAHYRLLDSIARLPGYGIWQLRKISFKDQVQRPVNIIQWANQLGIAKIDIQKEIRQILFVRQFLSFDLGDFEEKLTPQSFQDFLKKTKSNPKLTSEFRELFGNIKTFSEMQTALQGLNLRVQNKTQALIEILIQKEYVADQILAYRVAELMEMFMFINSQKIDPALRKIIQEKYVQLLKKQLPPVARFDLKTFNEINQKARASIRQFIYREDIPENLKSDFDKLMQELN
jgi:hypothetical protein